MNMNTTKKSITSETVYKVRHFLPLLTSAGFALGMLLGHIKFFEALGIAMMFIGLISAFTVCPLKLLAFPFRCVAVGFKVCRGFIPVYGVADLCAAIFGTCLGFSFGIAVVFFAPAIFTLKKYFSEQE